MRKAMRRSGRILPAVLALALLVGQGTMAAEGEALARRHAEMSGELAHSPFNRPLVLEAADSDSTPSGQVFAVVDFPFRTVAEVLQQPANWCALMQLQTNVKRCNVVEAAGERRIDAAVARRYTDPAEDAQPVSFRFQSRVADSNHLSVDLAADEGPVGTRDYRLRFEAVPISPDRSFVHLAYDYQSGYAARMATQLYLMTAGRNKVGFSVVRKDDAGQPVYIGGVRGVVERNVMRYFLAIESLLASQATPPAKRLDVRLHHFHDSLERYPAQLHETTLDEYLAMKRRELGGSGAE